jgi:imidazolonepropionase-like amidohydrolase
MASAAFAFVDVNVVPMDSERTIERQTVVVNGDRIVDVGPVATTVVPEGTMRIEGSGKYLMPGLADMHVHYNEPWYGPMFLANGVTTVRNMWGSRWMLETRQAVAAGNLLAPTIVTAGPLIDGEPSFWPTCKTVTSEAEAEATVDEQAEAGYDFIKVYDSLSVQVYDALVRAARRRGLPVAGHVPHAVGLEHALGSGQASIEHLTSYIMAIQAEDSPHRPSPRPEQALTGVRFADRSRIAGVVDATLRAGVWNCVTLVALRKSTQPDAFAQLQHSPELRFLPGSLVNGWDATKGAKWQFATPDFLDALRGANDLRHEITKSLHESGARILLGTDTANPFVVPGFAIHEELELLVDAGLTPFEALRAGTSGAAEFLHATHEFGTIKVGARADLLLTNGNPLGDVRHASSRVGVMVRGRWLPAEELDSMLNEVARTDSGANS